MTIEIKRVCDKCKSNVPPEEPLWGLSLNCSIIKSSNSQYPTTARPPYFKGEMRGLSNEYRVDYCEPCILAMGLEVDPNIPEDEQPKPPTIEDIIYDMVQEVAGGYYEP